MKTPEIPVKMTVEDNGDGTFTHTIEAANEPAAPPLRRYQRDPGRPDQFTTVSIVE